MKSVINTITRRYHWGGMQNKAFRKLSQVQDRNKLLSPNHILKVRRNRSFRFDSSPRQTAIETFRPPVRPLLRSKPPKRRTTRLCDSGPIYRVDRQTDRARAHLSRDQFDCARGRVKICTVIQSRRRRVRHISDHTQFSFFFFAR